MAELNVSKKSITALLGNMQNRLFVIPEYQRPYQWTTEHCDVLWEDIKYFSENSKEREYFLGTLVKIEAAVALFRGTGTNTIRKGKATNDLLPPEKSLSI